MTSQWRQVHGGQIDDVEKMLDEVLDVIGPVIATGIKWKLELVKAHVHAWGEQEIIEVGVA